MGYTHATRRAEQSGVKKQKIHARSISQYNKPARERERIKEREKSFMYTLGFLLLRFYTHLDVNTEKEGNRWLETVLM